MSRQNFRHREINSSRKWRKSARKSRKLGLNFFGKNKMFLE
jgi:hypothetical protein